LLVFPRCLSTLLPGSYFGGGWFVEECACSVFEISACGCRHTPLPSLRHQLQQQLQPFASLEGRELEDSSAAGVFPLGRCSIASAATPAAAVVAAAGRRSIRSGVSLSFPPDFGGLWYKPGESKEAICDHDEGWLQDMSLSFVYAPSPPPFVLSSCASVWFQQFGGAGSFSALISQKVFIELFCKSQMPHKLVNLSSTVTRVKDKLTNLCGNRLLPNDFRNTLCEISSRVDI
jgi:hypothetical protein